MRRAGWILAAVGLSALQLWVIFTPTPPMDLNTHPILFSSILLLFGGPAVAGLWVLVRILRYEKRPFPVILIPLLIPNSFLWYYFERIKPSNEAKAARSSAS